MRALLSSINSDITMNCWLFGKEQVNGKICLKFLKNPREQLSCMNRISSQLKEIIINALSDQILSSSVNKAKTLLQ